MTTTVTMLQTRLGENGSLWTVGNSYAASDAFAAVLISSNLATGTLPKSRSLVPLWGQTDTTGAVASLVDGGGKSFVGNGVVSPRNFNPRLRYGNAVSNGANSTARTNQQSWVFPFDIYGFQIGWESNETVDTTISLTRWSICGAAGGSLTATLDDVANFHTLYAATPRSLTYGGSASGVIAQRLALDVPGPTLWSDVAYGKVLAGQALTVRALQSSTTAYPLSPNGVPRADTISANPSFAVAAWTDATDRVTTVTSWGVTSSNFTANLPIPYINLLTDAVTCSVAVVGDSTTTGFTNSGTQSYPPLQRACELLGATGGVQFVPFNRGWSGKEASSYYTYALSVIASAYRPDILIYQLWSQNNTTSTTYEGELARAMDVVSRCRRAGIAPILMTGIPLVGLSLAKDNERKAINAEIKTWGVPVIDADAVITDGASPASYLAAYGAAAHPNYAGYSALAAEYARVLAGV